jgi:hypothetical protein
MTQVGIGYAAVSLTMATAAPHVANLLSAAPSVVTAATRYLTVVGPSFGATGIVVTAFTVLQHLGFGPLALLLNLGYFAAVLSIGALTTAHGVLANLYWTMAIAAAASLVTGLPLACWTVTRAILQSHRTHRPGNIL